MFLKEEVKFDIIIECQIVKEGKEGGREGGKEGGKKEGREKEKEGWLLHTTRPFFLLS